MNESTKQKISAKNKGRIYESRRKTKGKIFCLKCQKPLRYERKYKLCKDCLKNDENFKKSFSKTMSKLTSGENNPMFGKSPKHTKQIIVETFKSISTVIVRSSNEANFIKEIENDNKVISFEYEPTYLKCTYITDNKIKTYQPDFIVHYKNKSIVVEIKAKWMHEHPDTLIKEKAFKLNFNFEYLIRE